MDMPNFIRHQKALVRIESMETLRMLKVQEYMHLKDDARSKFYKEINDMANPPALRKTHTFDEITQIFGMLNAK